MPNKSDIEWTDYTSNPVYAVNNETGKRGHHCVHKNPLCERCYAESINLRWGTGLRFIAQNGERVSFGLNVKELDALSKLDARLHKKGETAKVFMCDMTDIALPGIPRPFIFEVLDRIALFRALTVQLLTKRPDEMLGIVKEYCAARGDISPEAFRSIFPHVHMGASVGTQRTADEDVPELLELGPYFEVPWLSVEPLLGPLDIRPYLINRYLHGGDAFHEYYNVRWGVIGGESGSGARVTHVEHILSVSEQFRLAGQPRFIKQVGSKPVAADLTHWRCPSKLLPDASGYALKLKDSKGGDPSEWIEPLRVREFPV